MTDEKYKPRTYRHSTDLAARSLWKPIPPGKEQLFVARQDIPAVRRDTGESVTLLQGHVYDRGLYVPHLTAP